MDDLSSSLIRNLPAPPMREYYSRTLAYVAMAATVTAGVICHCFTYEIIWLIPYLLIYPHLAHQIGRRFRHQYPEETRLWLLFVDAMHTGSIMALLGFSIVPSMISVLLLASISLVSGGLRYLSLTMLVTLSSAALCAALSEVQIDLNTPPLVAMVSLSFSALHICVTAYFVHRQSLKLMEVTQGMTEEKHKAAQLAQNLAKYLSPQVWESIFTGQRSVRLETQRKKLTVFFSDIKDFTELSDELEAEALTDLLNSYLNEMSKICLKYGGTIDKFVGDSLMVFFGDPTSNGSKIDAINAVSMAIAMRNHMRVMRQQWRKQGITKPLQIRMGLNTGYCTVGNFGADTRMDYTIIGREVNLASRLESAADTDEILISHETYSLIKDQIVCHDKGNIWVKGFTRPVKIYQVADFRHCMGKPSSYIEHEIPGFSMSLDTNHLNSYDKERIISALREAAHELEKDTVNPD
ncbi:adenylate/guanylate cyclase domain-containing protein [Pseudomonas sp. TTU2014-080ASC]|uniref:adenylate/guanylate cyclase domain-containing protein n=1 Tax=Pseudomonas sp. TTU2014-080ASC TaxID=1729724 RepID=UPI0007184EBC|nr:adenylate/guanylate cyclase domain-containing protein [Pseudomonas sp. TTU2014-080ASC]KRW62221.1 adenylate cyclase [Pseudomonas sp. TTU2014-080ASC]